MLVSTTPNAICATATLAISYTLGSAAVIIVETETFSYPSFSKSLNAISISTCFLSSGSFAFLFAKSHHLLTDTRSLIKIITFLYLSQQCPVIIF